MGYKLYCEAIDRGIAREQARLFMPMNLYIEFIFSINARSLMNFLSLRNEDNAIYEIQEYADAIEQLWGDVMPDTAAAFVGNNRIAP
jgi:thymidylate synthase (FAD)